MNRTYRKHRSTASILLIITALALVVLMAEMGIILNISRYSFIEKG